MKAEEFYTQFLGLIEGGDNYLSARNRYWNDYTHYINNYLLPNYFASQGYKCNNEYYRVDFVASKLISNTSLQNACDGVGMNYHLWNLELAFEHENIKTDWYDEVIKLLNINANLSVVVGYNAYSDRQSKDKNDIEKMKVVCKLIEQVDNYANKLKDREFLIILGNGSNGSDFKNFIEKTDGTFFDYRGYKIYLENGKVLFKQV